MDSACNPFFPKITPRYLTWFTKGVFLLIRRTGGLGLILIDFNVPEVTLWPSWHETVLQCSQNTTVFAVGGLLRVYRYLVFKGTSLIYTLYAVANKTKYCVTQGFISLAVDTSSSTENVHFPFEWKEVMSLLIRKENFDLVTYTKSQDAAWSQRLRRYPKNTATRRHRRQIVAESHVIWTRHTLK
jgi:hypothetical protein